MPGQRYLAHLVAAEEVGPNIFDLHCSCGRWQSFTVHGENHARELGNDHITAAKLADRMTFSNDAADRALKRDLYGYHGVS